MADEKLKVRPEKSLQPSLFDAGPADAPAPETPAPGPGSGEHSRTGRRDSRPGRLPRSAVRLQNFRKQKKRDCRKPAGEL